MKFRVRSVAYNAAGKEMSAGIWHDREIAEPPTTGRNIRDFITNEAPKTIHSYPNRPGDRVVVEVERLSGPEPRVPNYVGKTYSVVEGGDLFTIVPVLRAQSPHGTVQEINGQYRTLYFITGSSFPLGNDGDVRNKLLKWVKHD